MSALEYNVHYAEAAWEKAEHTAKKAFIKAFFKANEVSRIRSKAYRKDAIIESAEADKDYRKAKVKASEAHTHWRRLVEAHEAYDKR